MHTSANQYGKAFFQNYITKIEKPIIVELGSQDVNGSLRQHAPKDANYIGLDFAPGKSVDVVLKDAYHFPFPDNYADFVITSSCFEHSQFFWLSFIESMRILKPNGVIYINAPSNGMYHRYPTDNWRFYPDSGQALTKYAQLEGYQAVLLESFIGAKLENWRDFVAVIAKDQEFIAPYTDRIYNNMDKYLAPTNIWSYGNKYICRFDDLLTEAAQQYKLADCAGECFSNCINHNFEE
jgi:SAM-dependent methyltransferase